MEEEDDDVIVWHFHIMF